MANKINKTEEGKVKASAFVVQLLATLCICFLTGLTGFVFAWPSYTLENFTSNSTVLSWPMSTTEVAMLSSITNIGGLIATPFCGYAMDKFGRKYSAMLFGIPFVLAWLIISLTRNVYLIITAIGLAGAGAAGQAVSSIYISEISQDSIRGSLTSMTVMGYYSGLLLGYILGGSLTYQQVICSYLSLSVLYILLLTLLKESPVFLMMNGREEEAARAISFYQRVDVISKQVENELNKIKIQLNTQNGSKLDNKKDAEIAQKLLRHRPEKTSESSWKILRNSKASRRALATSLTLMVSNIMMGAVVLQVYAEPLFKKATPSMPSNLCSIFMAVDLLVSSIVCAVMMDKFGRKFLMTSTSIGAGLCTLGLATQLQLEYAPAWVTAFFIYAYTCVNNLGAAAVPFVFTAEVFLPEVRGLANSIVYGSTWIFFFLILIVFTPIVKYLGLSPVFYGFTAVCFFTATFSHFFVPETKGLSTDAIQLLFIKEKKVKEQKC